MLRSEKGVILSKSEKLDKHAWPPLCGDADRCAYAIGFHRVEPCQTRVRRLCHRFKQPPQRGAVRTLRKPEAFVAGHEAGRGGLGQAEAVQQHRQREPRLLGARGLGILPNDLECAEEVRGRSKVVGALGGK